MADTVAITAGAGTSVATDDIGTVHYQRIKLVHGIDGVNDGDVANVNPLPVSARQSQFWYEADIPGVAAAVYAAGDQFGTLITITNAARATGGGGFITGVTLYDNDDLQVGADVFFFNDTLTLALDNAVYAISDADARKYLWACQFPYFMDTGAQRVASNVGVSVPYFCTGTSLFAAVRTQSAVTPSATGVRMRVSMIRD